MAKRWVLTGLLGLFLLCNATKAAATEFTYRGVKFGMTREEVSKLVPMEEGSNRAVGRTGFVDKKVYFQFDDTGKLYAIEISYFVPHPEHLNRPAMRRALQKKYGVSKPLEKVWDLGDASMSFEEYYVGNLLYLRTTVTDKRFYDEYLDRMAARLAPSLQD